MAGGGWWGWCDVFYSSYICICMHLYNIYIHFIALNRHIYDMMWYAVVVQHRLCVGKCIYVSFSHSFSFSFSIPYNRKTIHFQSNCKISFWYYMYGNVRNVWSFPSLPRVSICPCIFQFSDLSLLLVHSFIWLEFFSLLIKYLFWFTINLCVTLI